MSLLTEQEEEFFNTEVARLLFNNESYTKLSPSTALTVLRSIMEESVYNDNLETLEDIDMLDSVKQIKCYIRRDESEHEDDLNEDERKTAIVRFISSQLVTEITEKMLASKRVKSAEVEPNSPVTNKTTGIFPPVPSSAKKEPEESSSSSSVVLPPVPQGLLKVSPPPIDKERLRKNQQQFWDKPCILIVGDSGTGKSSLINAIFGTEQKIGVGKPVTQDISLIEDDTLILIDSKGFEKESEGDDAMKKLTEFLSSRTFSTKVHMVWYVIAADSTRVQFGTKEICERYFKDLPTFFLLTKCDRVSPKNLQIMKDAVVDLRLNAFSGVFGLSVRPPSVLEYPVLCPECVDTSVEPVFNKDDTPQTIYCNDCKGTFSACRNCVSAKLLLDTTEQSWFCKGCKEEWPQMTTSESEFDGLIKATYDKFITINEEYAIKFKKGLLLKHLQAVVATTATAVTAGLSGAVVGAMFGGLIGAAVGAVGASFAGMKIGLAASERFTNPYDESSRNEKKVVASEWKDQDTEGIPCYSSGTDADVDTATDPFTDNQEQVEQQPLLVPQE